MVFPAAGLARKTLWLVAALAVSAFGAGSTQPGSGGDVGRTPRISRPHAPVAPVASGARGAPRYRFIYSSGSAPATVASYGWNLIDVGSRWAADRLPPGTK